MPATHRVLAMDRLNGSEPVLSKEEAPMLVLSRKSGERIRIGDGVTLTVVRIGPNSVRLGIDAPRSMRIVREELIIEYDDSEAPPAEPGQNEPAVSNDSQQSA